MLTLELKMPEGVKDRSYNKLEEMREVYTYLKFYQHYKHSPIGVHIYGTSRPYNEYVDFNFKDIKSPLHYNAVVFEIGTFSGEIL